MSKITTALQDIFSKHRLVFWYDDKEELRQEYEEMDLPGVIKIEVSNDEFNVKYRVTREEPARQFLLYFPFSRPPDIENWLLDLLLANYEFRTDQSAIFLQELGLEYEFKSVVTEHIDFFKSTARINALKDLLDPDDQESRIRLKMLAVICKCEADLEHILMVLLDDLAAAEDGRLNLVARYSLDGFLWDQSGKIFGYYNDTPSRKDFLIELFNTNYCAAVSGAQPSLNKEAIVLMNRWKDSVAYRDSFEHLSDELAGSLAIKKDLEGRDYKSLVRTDIYKLFDQKIIYELKNGLIAKAISYHEIKEVVRRRENTHWYDQYKHIYQTIFHAANFIELIDLIDLNMDSLADGLTKYRENYHRLDYHYRKFVYHLQKAGQTALLEDLGEYIEKQYSNNYLLPLNDRWQQLVDSCKAWNGFGIVPQSKFFTRFVKPYLNKGKKVFVLISDALRYEVAVELLERILQEDRFTAELTPMLASIPSYTQLGMAALLPHETLTYRAESDVVEADGLSTQGTANRRKILDRYLPGKATAIKASDLLALNTMKEGRDLTREHDLVYVYHNGIDAIGDKRETEGRVFEAVEQEFERILEILKKIANINGNNVLITADHGFIYQNTPIDESDFTKFEKAGQILAYNRRFVIGRNLPEPASARKFTAGELGLSGDHEFLIARSINRFRVKGAGSRFVHGGTSLQEVVIPVIEFNKKRSSDIQQVDVDVVKTTSQITSAQVTISFYQEKPVGEKMLPRELRVGFYSKSGTLISDAPTLLFDSAQTSGRNREKKVNFIFSRKADDFNNQEVVLRLEESIKGTSHYRTYKEFAYTLKKSFASDFDEF